MARVAALARLVEALASGDQGWLDDAMEKRLREVSAERDADVAALALATLHLGRGGDRGTRRFLARTLSRAGGHDGALRDRWALVLGYVGDRLAAEGRHDDAIAAYRKALEVSPSSAPLLTNLANAERDGARDGTQLASAIANYGRSLRLDPASSLSLVNLGIAQATSGDTAAALASWRDAMRMNPGEPLARFNLGNALLLGGHFAEAAAAYRATIALDAGIAPAHFNLARALAAAGQYGEALRALQGGLRVDSTDAGARAMAAQLREMGVRR
jgi:tetratricopeptide (TPR) repeat protein